MGAAAGARLLSMLVARCQELGAVRDSDFPEIFLHNIPSRGMDEHGVADPGLVFGELRNSCILLENAGASVIIIACNTVHEYIADLQSITKVQILSMVGTAADAAAHRSGKHNDPATSVGVISSRSSKESRLYVDALSFRDTPAIETTDDEQDVVDEMIGRAIAGQSTGTDRKLLTRMVFGMQQRGANEVILACTELPLVGIHPDLYTDPYTPLIDRVLCVSSATVQ
jgi:aspartate/glutamate racemase